MSWALRRATLLDLAPIMALEEATFPDDTWSPEQMAAELASPHGYYLVAVAPELASGGTVDEDETPDAVVGYAGLLAPAGSGQGDVQTIAVAPAARRRGLGRALLQALLEEAAVRAAHEVFLEVRDDNPSARALYESEGFAAIDRRRGYYNGVVDAIVMKREARP